METKTEHDLEWLTNAIKDFDNLNIDLLEKLLDNIKTKETSPISGIDVYRNNYLEDEKQKLISRLKFMIINKISNKQITNDGLMPSESDKPESKIINKPTVNRGRPNCNFRDKLLCEDKDSLIEKLHTLIDGKKGKDVALVIHACINSGKMTKPTFKMVQDEFGNIGNRSGFNKYMCTSNAYTDDEIKGVQNQFKTSCD